MDLGSQIKKTESYAGFAKVLNRADVCCTKKPGGVFTLQMLKGFSNATESLALLIDSRLGKNS